MLEWIYSPEAWISLLTLTSLEIVLGIDNIIFIAILCGKLPAHQRDRARVLGLGLAMVTRILLLLSLFWIMKLTTPLFSLFDYEISGRDLVLIAGGLFLIAKSTLELHSHTTGENEEDSLKAKGASNFFATIVQIGILDIVFSLDSVITAVGMADHIEIMIIAVILAVLVMLLASGSISRFVDNNPTIKVLALAFLIMIGIALVGEGFKFHIPKGYIYFAMAFSLAVEMINLYAKRKHSK
ncbi:TerC family protein [Campylobacter fetus]|uniref:TerC family protein n=1 Tax=Campylobacter fetus TaxID=196 RepID=A0A5L4ILA3_CAMFE|nr:TerC family protein [Campylobacter fetus]EAI4414302.1 TerC family protein [Campylobacter fetus]EAK0416395.1 TerC family protein [Campylobacter fetus]EAK0453435.1 TerC family protein [Campylobacter fetus]EAL3873743.1 TerC family protein [Campylobacter fetus]EGK8151078.1 TerC family protein [Campylobacter fetus]